MKALQLPEEAHNLVDLLYEIEDLELQERLFESVAIFIQQITARCPHCVPDRFMLPIIEN